MDLLRHQDFTNVANKIYLLGSSILVILLANLGLKILSFHRLRRAFPAVDSGLTKSIFDAEPLYREGYRKFKDSIYRVTTADGDRLMIPNAYFDELYQTLEKDPNSTDKAQAITLEAKHTGLSVSKFMIHTIFTDLTRNIGRIHDTLSKAVDEAVETEILPVGTESSNDEWTTVTIDEALARIVAIASGTIFIGHDVARRKEWLDAAANFTTTAFIARFLIKWWPAPLRGIISPFLPHIWSVRRQKRAALKFLVPIVQRRRKMIENGEDVPNDMLQWMLNKHEFADSKNDKEVANQQLQLTWVALHTASLTATSILYDLLLHGGSIIDELREEIQATMKEHGGKLTVPSLPQLKLLDSVMKESQRMHPLGLTRYVRYVQDPIHLHDGKMIPSGAIVEVPHIAQLRDETIYPQAQLFDPYRFYHIRTGERPDPFAYKNKDLHQFATATRENLTWGYGQHACPGRFFATNEIKLILSRILTNFDLKLPEGMTAKEIQDYFTPNTITSKKHQLPEMKSVLAILAGASLAASHATFQQLWVDGVDQADSCVRRPASNSPVTSVTGNDLRCNTNGAAGVSGVCDVPAGSTVEVEMHEQPNDRSCTKPAIGGNHDGPVIVYMASVDDATSADGSDPWFKVAEYGYNADADLWGTDYLNENCGLPANLPQGDYLVRAEVIALHVAGSAGGAQFYMSCFQITVSGGSGSVPSGVSFPGAYSATDPGILYNVYSGDNSKYIIPGPAVAV
ncbi:putative ent-kaurene oxidase [Paramyrothecium foliicola]|nr:putative ent-kaurene oxidase [Paramyrothecium foliicola]